MIIRSTKIKLNYGNKKKVDTLFYWLNQSVSDLMTTKINNLIYSAEKIPALLPKSYTDQLPFSARINQLLAKEISSVARSIKSKLIKAENKNNKEKYQQELIDKFVNKTLKVNWNGNINLDSRFISIEQNKESKSFDYWLIVTYPGIPKTYIPIKSTKHMKDLLSRGYLLKTKSIKICRNNIIHLFFEKEEFLNKNQETIGIDIGRNKAFITSNGEISNQYIKILLNSLKKQKQGSKSKQARIRQMKQLIDLSVKEDIDWSNLTHITLEKLTNMKLGKSWGNTNHHWSYQYIQNRINLQAQELGVQVKFVNPAYTSQTCLSCGHTHKNNRKSELFKCVSCGYEADADLIGAVNIRNRGSYRPHCDQEDRFI